MKKTVAAGLTVGLALTALSGCEKKKETFDTAPTAITVNGDTVSVGVVNFAVRHSQANLENLYMSLGVADPYSSDLFGNGSTLGATTVSQSVDMLTEAVLAKQHMEEFEVTVSEDEKKAISEAAAKFIADNDAEVLAELGATQEAAEEYMELNLIQAKMEPKMYADVDTEVSDEEAAQRRVQYVIFTPVTEEAVEAESEEGTEAVVEAVEPVSEEAEKTQSAEETELATEEALAEEVEAEPETEDPETAAARERAKAQAEEFLAKVKAGEDFAEAAESMGKTATENTFGADYSISELVEATEGLEDGTLVEEPVFTSNGNYFVVKVLSQLDREATDSKKETIVKQRQNEKVQGMYTEWEEAGEITVDQEALSKIAFNFHLTQPEAAPEPETANEAQTE